ncbi:MAG: tetratricopeptide repeat protein [Terriglobia bacterium]|jgi:serine/threonine-protein kinase|nr:tetratricopeptide repeat protein [Terriglobia bacterium]
MQPFTEQADVTAPHVRAALQRIVTSVEFSRSPQLQRFLTFVVNEALSGRSERLKEYTIGVEVFARPASYDPRLDSLVRVEAKRLRDLLEHYYENNGKSEGVRVELPRGSYVPVFRAEKGGLDSTAVARKSHWSRTWILLPIATALLTGISAYFGVRTRQETAKIPRTIAVLPFENLSSDPENEYLCFGLLDEVTTDLAKHQNLRVIARTSSSRFKRGDDIATIARQLKADAILEGSVSKWGDRIRVTAQLINASDSVHLWAENFEGTGHDPLMVQNDVSQKIANAVALRMVGNGQSEHRPVQYSGNPEANLLYWKGAYFRKPIGTLNWRQNLAKSAEFFEGAVQKDPQFAAAYSALADVCATMGWESSGFSDTAEYMKCARESATHALALDDSISEAYAALATVQFSYDYDHVAAEKSFQRALQLNPSDARAHMWYAVALAPLGRFDESRSQARQAKELDPLSFATANQLAFIEYLARRYGEAGRVAREILDMDPKMASSHAILGVAYEAQGNRESAISEYKEAVAINANQQYSIGRLGRLYAIMGRQDEARTLVNEIEATRGTGVSSDVYQAYIFLGLLEFDNVFRHLDLAYARHDPDLPFIAVDPIFDPVRSDPRYIATLKKLRLR